MAAKPATNPNRSSNGTNCKMLGRLQASHTRLPPDEVDVLDALADETAHQRPLTFGHLKEAQHDGAKMKAALNATPTTILHGNVHEIGACHGATVAETLATSCVTTIIVDGSTANNQTIAVLAAIFHAGNKQLSQLVVKSGDVATKLFGFLENGLPKNFSPKLSLRKVIVDTTMQEAKEVTKLVQRTPIGVKEVVVRKAACQVDINDMLAFHDAVSKSHARLTQDEGVGDMKALHQQSITAFKSPLAPTTDYAPLRNMNALGEDQMAFGVGFNKLVPVTTKGLRHSMVVKGFMDLSLGSSAAVDGSGPVSVEDKVVALDIDEEPPGLLSVQCMACFLDHVVTDDDTTLAQKETQPRCHVPPHHFSFLLTLKAAVDGDENKYTALLAQLLQLAIYYNIPALKRLARSGLVLKIGTPSPSVKLPQELEGKDVTIVELDWAASEWAYQNNPALQGDLSAATNHFSFNGSRLKLVPGAFRNLGSQYRNHYVYVLPKEEFGSTAGLFYFEFGVEDVRANSQGLVGLRGANGQWTNPLHLNVPGDNSRVGVLVSVAPGQLCSLQYYVNGQGFNLDGFNGVQEQGPCRFGAGFVPRHSAGTIITDVSKLEG